MARVLLSILFLLPFSIFAQVTEFRPISAPGETPNPGTRIVKPFVCGTADPTPAQIRYTLDVIDKQLVDRNAGTTCIPIHIIDVRTSAGGDPLDMDELNEGIANLNRFYLPAGVEFYICGTGVTVVNNDTYYNYNSTDEAALAAAAPEVTNAVNVFFVKSISVGAGSAAGYAYFPFNSLQSNRILMDKDIVSTYDNGTFVHEFGHWFALYHTHQDTEFGNTDPDAENVPRTGVDANCGIAGDLLCDTEADPRYSAAEFDLSTCSYTGTGTDINGVAYVPPVNNVMSYFPDQCGGILTTDQLTRSAAAFVVRQGHTAYTLDCPPTVVIDPSGLTTTYNTGVSITINWTDNAGNETGYLVERSTTSATAGFEALEGGGVGPNTTTFTDFDLVPNATHYYRVKASNDDCNDYSNVDSEVVGLVHCKPTYQSNGAGTPGNCVSTPVYLNDFTLSTLSNTGTGCSYIAGTEPPINYANYTGSIAALTLNQGTTYSFTASGNLTNYYSVWIDLNADGVFSDCERLYYSTAIEGTSVTRNITIPLGATNGTTVLRVRASNQTVMTDACGYTPFGETEDYAVTIAAPGTCPTWASIPTAGGTYVPDAVCQDGTWTHFYNSGAPTQLLFSMENITASGALLDPADVSIGVTAGYGTGGHNITAASYVTNPSGWWAFGRYWDVDPCQQPGADINVRFYFDNQDVTDINGSIAGTISGATQLRFYKITDSALDPNPSSAAHLTITGGDYSEYENDVTASIGTWTHTAYGAYDHAEFPVSSFSGGGGGSGGGGNNTGATSILPVSFLHLSGEAMVGKNQINWATGYETNNERFVIERFDAQLSRYLAVGEVIGQGTTQQVTDYQFFDENPLLGLNTYRIKQIDFDGNFIYSRSVELSSLSPSAPSLFPNPAKDLLKVWIEEGSTRQVSLSLLDLSGRKVWTRAWKQSGESLTEIDISDLPSGLYLYQLRVGNRPYLGKISIE
ncbi:MAG: GEVED domain-containing protein [Bacteroidota bacterium]